MSWRPPTSTLFPYTTLFRSGLRDAATLAEMLAGTHASRDFTDLLGDRKSTRLNSSHPSISYAVFCLKKKKPDKQIVELPTEGRHFHIARRRSIRLRQMFWRH